MTITEIEFIAKIALVSKEPQIIEYIHQLMLRSKHLYQEETVFFSPSDGIAAIKKRSKPNKPFSRFIQALRLVYESLFDSEETVSSCLIELPKPPNCFTKVNSEGLELLNNCVLYSTALNHSENKGNRLVNILSLIPSSESWQIIKIAFLSSIRLSSGIVSYILIEIENSTDAFLTTANSFYRDNTLGNYISKLLSLVLDNYSAFIPQIDSLSKALLPIIGYSKPFFPTNKTLSLRIIVKIFESHPDLVKQTYLYSLTKTVESFYSDKHPDKFHVSFETVKIAATLLSKCLSRSKAYTDFELAFNLERLLASENANKYIDQNNQIEMHSLTVDLPFIVGSAFMETVEKLPEKLENWFKKVELLSVFFEDRASVKEFKQLTGCSLSVSEEMTTTSKVEFMALLKTYKGILPILIRYKHSLDPKFFRRINSVLHVLAEEANSSIAVEAIQALLKLFYSDEIFSKKIEFDNFHNWFVGRLPSSVLIDKYRDAVVDKFVDKVKKSKKSDNLVKSFYILTETKLEFLRLLPETVKIRYLCLSSNFQENRDQLQTILTQNPPNSFDDFYFMTICLDNLLTAKFEDSLFKLLIQWMFLVLSSFYVDSQDASKTAVFKSILKMSKNISLSKEIIALKRVNFSKLAKNLSPSIEMLLFYSKKSNLSCKQLLQMAYDIFEEELESLFKKYNY